jgi:hypothetical protein
MKALFTLWETDPPEEFKEMLRIYDIVQNHAGTFVLEYHFSSERQKYYFLYKFEIPNQPLHIILKNEPKS